MEARSAVALSEGRSRGKFAHSAARSSIALVAAAGISAMAITTWFAAPAVAQQDEVAAGQRVWAGKAGCQQCHGWSGDGRGGFHSEGHAASLRLTELTRDQIRTTIQCGRPGTPMPHFDRFAYTDKRCYDMTEADLGDQVPNRAVNTLQAYEIDALADYIAAKFKGAGPPTRDQCLDFFKAEAGTRCDQYP